MEVLEDAKKSKENARKCRGTQKAVTEAIGVSQQSINKYKNHNIEPDIKTLVRLAKFFHCSVDYLIGHCDTKHDHLHDFTTEECTLRYTYRNLNRLQKAAIHAVIDSYKR